MRRILFCMAFISIPLLCGAQGSSGNSFLQDFKAWRNGVLTDYKQFRSKILHDYADFVRKPWSERDEKAPTPAPKDDNVPPVVAPVDIVPKPVEDKPVIIEDVVVPTPNRDPQPQPVAPIEEVPVVDVKYLDFMFFGTPAQVRFDVKDKVKMRGVRPDDIADAILAMSGERYDNLIVDCLALREKHHLSDWAYLQMLKAMAESVCGASTNEAELLMAYVYIQSGYKMRLAHDGYNLYMLYSSKHRIFNQSSYDIDGDLYYCLREMPRQLFICEAIFPKEQSLSLYINNAIELAPRSSDKRVIAAQGYQDARFSVSVNQNLLDFYNTYPTSMLGDDVCTRWAMYANTPMQKDVAEALYPQFRTALSGKSKLQAAEILLNWVQTGFKYEYDDKVWGGDRAFFSEESLFYPYCDCEDRSILFTRLVRDLLGLKCILVYYPGHLASAVRFPDSVSGDYIQLGGQRYTVCDPTYIGAPVGMTMPDMDNQTAKVILLE